MARDRASITVDIWADGDFRELTAAAQALWFKLYSHPQLSYCGVVDFHPGRLAALSKEQTADDVIIAAQELSDKWWCVFDQGTDEVLVRGFLRKDGLLRQPKLAVSAAKAFAAVASNKLRAVIVAEVARYKKENPDLGAWDQTAVKVLLKQEAVEVQQTETGLVWEAFRLPAA